MYYFQKPTLARFFLILAFPLWFPRLVFWLVVEFCRVKLSEWFPGAFQNRSSEVWGYENPELLEDAGKCQRNKFTLIEGGDQAAVSPTIQKDRRRHRLLLNSPGLRLIKVDMPQKRPEKIGRKNAL